LNLANHVKKRDAESVQETPQEDRSKKEKVKSIKTVLRLAAFIAITASAQDLPELKGTAPNNPGIVNIQYRILKGEAFPGNPAAPPPSRVSIRLISALQSSISSPYVKLEIMGTDDVIRDVKLQIPCLLIPGGPACYVSSDLSFEAKLIRSADLVPCPDCVPRNTNISGIAPDAQTNTGKKPKHPKLPTQMDMTSGCVSVRQIYSHGLSIFSGVGAPEPGLDAFVYNGCAATVHIDLEIGYFDGNEQFGDGIEIMTLASGAQRHIYHVASVYGFDRARMKSARIISILAL
jgi:hypothetical protein